MMHKTIEPNYLVELITTTGATSSNIIHDKEFLSIDAANMKNILKNLEDASAAFQSVHSNRIKRYIT